MSLRLYLIFMTLTSLCAWIAWLIVLHTIDPTKTGFLGYFLFYTSLGFSFLTSLTLFGTIIRVWLKKDELAYKHVIRSLRQGLLFSVLFITALVLSGLGLLVWWVMILLIFIATTLEVIFLTPTEHS